MHYYKRNIGDYHKKAGRLSILEHGSYTLLIDACYDRERFPTLDEAIDWVWARTPEEIDSVRFVLTKFFELRDGVYFQQRVFDELARYHENAETNKNIALQREAARRNKRIVNEACSTVNEPPPNQEPRTKNQEPLTNESIKSIGRKRQSTKRPDDWAYSEKHKELAASAGLNVSDQCQKFMDWHDAKGSVFADWDAAFRTWLRRSSDMKPKAGAHDLSNKNWGVNADGSF